MVTHFLIPAAYRACRPALCGCFFLLTAIPGFAQQTPQSANSSTPAAASIRILTSGTRTSIRGLSAVSEKVIWVSGSNGTVGRSVDGGNTWTWITVPGYEKRDFRDIEAFDENTAIIMAISEPGDILKTVNGGRNWRLVYENPTPGIFMDAMEFWNKESGIVVGDPINGRFFVTRSFDGGDSWHDIPWRELPTADSGEGCFASSGTNVRNLDRDEAVFVSGGPHSRIFIRDSAINLPIIQGTPSTGANSVAVKDHNKMNGGKYLIVVGGDFTKDTLQDRNCFLSTDRGKTWVRPDRPPHGYRSCVEFIGDDRVLCCGTSGVDISGDDGMNWTLVSHDSFHVCRAAKKGKAVFLAGSGGRVARLVLPEQ
jgi:hypothetical protein